MRRLLSPASAVLLILVITAAWWALALWPLPDQTPAWIEQARLMCFGASRDTLPTPAGWMLLAGEPLAMLGLLGFIWPRARRLTAGALAIALMAGSAAVVLRVRAAQGTPFDPAADAPAPQWLLRNAPPLALVDQEGRFMRLEDFRGRAVLVVFAYAHCATVCPVVVHEALEAHRAVAGSALLIVTLDPWRDTPTRLPAIAAQWQLPADARVLSGPVDEVQRTIAEWEYPASRDSLTGEVTHATFVYVVDHQGRLAWQAPGRAAAIIPLLAGR